jgi:large subunit ribosomal protein L24
MPTTKRFAPKLSIKKGDRVMVIAGSNKGETGEIKLVLPKENRAIVEGLNMVKKHTKATQDSPGGINEIEAPIHISNLMLIDPKSGQPTRVGRKLVDGKLVRYSKKSGEIIK